MKILQMHKLLTVLTLVKGKATKKTLKIQYSFRFWQQKCASYKKKKFFSLECYDISLKRKKNHFFFLKYQAKDLETGKWKAFSFEQTNL